MNKLKKLLALAGVAALCLSANNLMAQAGGGGRRFCRWRWQPEKF